MEYNPDTFRGKTVLCPCDDPEWSNFTKFFAQNFETLGLKKLISTSYAFNSKIQDGAGYQYSLEDYLTDFETTSSKYDKDISPSRGKIFTLYHDKNKTRTIDIDDLEWDYLLGNGDFRSDEVTRLRDEADIIITNPPFSLIRDFVAWVFEAKKQFLIIGRETIISYKEIFPLIKSNKLWTGATSNSSDMVFRVPEGTSIAMKDKEKAEKLGYKGSYTRLGNACWFTNIDHGRRHQNLELMTMADNLKFSRHKNIKTDGSQAAKIINVLGITVCPYCNQNHINIVHDKGGKLRFWGDLDHFHDKRTYPQLAVCLYNLIPVCKVCNQLKSFKSGKIANPYDNDYKTEITFRTEFDDESLKAAIFGYTDDHLNRVLSKFNLDIMNQLL